MLLVVMVKRRGAMVCCEVIHGVLFSAEEQRRYFLRDMCHKVGASGSAPHRPRQTQAVYIEMVSRP